MFTKWYKNILRARRNDKSIAGLKGFDGTTFTYYGNNRAQRCVYEIAIGRALAYAFLPDNFAGNGYPCVTFGSGTTPPTADDYTLESPLQNVTYSRSSVSVAETEEKDIYTNFFQITNNNEEAISVSEVGIVAPASSGSTTSINVVYTLIERTVFEPVTIAPGETATIQYEVVVTYPES